MNDRKRRRSAPSKQASVKRQNTTQSQPIETKADGGYSQSNSPLQGSDGRDLKVILLPAAAAANGRWQLGAQTYSSGHTQRGLTTTVVFISVTDVAGFLPPADEVCKVPLSDGYLATVKATYNGFRTQPASVAVAPGRSATFSVKVSGNPRSYQWQFKPSGGRYQNLPGKTAARCTVNNVTAAKVGAYRVVVTWANGGLASGSAALTIAP